MASTVSAATLTITVTEEITLNGLDYGDTNTLAIGSINEISSRIVNVDTSAARTLLDFDTAVGSGQYILANIKYIRITNVDDANYVELVINGASNNSCCFKLEAGKTFMVGAGSSVVEANDSAAITSASFANLDTITAKANTAAVDLQVFVAST